MLQLVMERGVLPGAQIQNIRGQLPRIKQRAAVFDRAAVNVKYDISVHKTLTAANNCPTQKKWSRLFLSLTKSPTQYKQKDISTEAGVLTFCKGESQ